MSRYDDELARLRHALALIEKGQTHWDEGPTGQLDKDATHQRAEELRARIAELERLKGTA